MAIIATSRDNIWGKTFFTASGYPDWSSFMNSYAISFTKSVDNLQGRSDSASATVNFPANGTYTVRCAADNAFLSSMTVDGKSCSVGPLTGSGSTTDIEVTAGPKTVNITIGNENTNVGLELFGDNPMGLAFTIEQKSIDAPPPPITEEENVTNDAGTKPTVTTPPPPKVPDESVFIGAGPKPAVKPWSDFFPTCAAKPAIQTSSGGMIISENGSSGIKLNLKNYANKLVTLKVVRQGTGAWQNGFEISIPDASDILVNGSPQGGSAYNRNDYTNPNVGSAADIIYLCNLDGGDYDYIFSHSSVPGPRPIRTNYTVKCTDSTADVPVNVSVDRVNYKEECTTSSEDVITTNEDGTTVITTVNTTNCDWVPFTETVSVPTTKKVTTTTCTWVPYPETYTGPWPHCYEGVGIKKTGGNEVSWCYEDGGGEPFCDQTVTVTVVDTREVIPSTGGICFTDIFNQVWIDDPGLSKTNNTKVWSDGVSSSNLVISGTERFMFDGLTSTKTVAQATSGVSPIKAYIQWDKSGVANLTGLTGPVKLQMVYQSDHVFYVNGSVVSVSSSLNDEETGLVQIAASGTTVNSFKVEAANTDNLVEIYAVEANAAIIKDEEVYIVEGKSLTEYRDHSTKIRFRNPASKSSKTSFPTPMCFTDFRGLAGAKTPSELGL